ARPMTAEARSICWTVWARETSCSLTAPTTPTLCVRRSRNAAPGRASNQCPDASTLRLSVPFFIVTETSSSASSTNSSTSAPSPRDTKNTPTTTSHSSSSLPSEYGCDLMSLCLRSSDHSKGLHAFRDTEEARDIGADDEVAGIAIFLGRGGAGVVNVAHGFGMACLVLLGGPADSGVFLLRLGRRGRDAARIGGRARAVEQPSLLRAAHGFRRAGHVGAL